MEWITAFLLLVAGAAILPVTLRAAKRSTRGKGGVGAVSIALGLAFSSFFDPPAKTASEEIEMSRDRRHREDAGGAVDQ